MMLLLVCFGAAIADGSILRSPSWETIAVTLLVLLVVRPVTGAIGLAGSPHRREQRQLLRFSESGASGPSIMSLML